jgi:hypothetical protein
MFKTFANIISTLFSKAEVENLNPNYEVFETIPNPEEALLDNSMIQRGFDDVHAQAQHQTVSAYKNLIYGNMSGDKLSRLKFYRQMANFPEVNDAIDEIVDSCINQDENEKIVSIKFTGTDKLSEHQKTQINREFEKFIGLFNFDHNAYEYFRDLVVEGEKAWENIVDTTNTQFGIVGINEIPTECFEYLVNDTYKIKGIVFNAKISENSKEGMQGFWNGQGYANIIDVYTKREEDKAIIPMPINQITLVNTGRYNSNKTIVYPILERARRAYRQLSLIEDAVIIYRLVRAPERLVFNVDVGKLPPRKAEELVYKMMKRYNSKKVYDPIAGTVARGYDPHQMQEAYWFPKPEGSTGTEVTPLQAGQNLGELEDLKYFLRKLYVSLKIPYDRFDRDQMVAQFDEMMSYDEYRFAKFIIRIQNNFAKGLQDTFTNHLKLIGLWKQYKLKPTSFNVKFNPPANFDLYTNQKLFDQKIQNYDSITSHEEFSKELAMQKYLGMSTVEVEQNNKMVEREQLRQAYIQKKIENIGSKGISENIPKDQYIQPPEETQGTAAAADTEPSETSE